MKSTVIENGFDSLKVGYVNNGTPVIAFEIKNGGQTSKITITNPSDVTAIINELKAGSEEQMWALSEKNNTPNAIVKFFSSLVVSSPKIWKTS